MSVIRLTSSASDINLDIDGVSRYLPLKLFRIYSISENANHGLVIKFPDLVPIKLFLSDSVYINNSPASIFDTITFLGNTIDAIIDTVNAPAIPGSLDDVQNGINRKALTAAEYETLQQIIQSFINS